MVLALLMQLPSERSQLELFGLFDNLLRKYARKLEYEDSYEDLRAFFFELLAGITERRMIFENDGRAVSYIVRAIKNQYIALSKRQQEAKGICFSDLSEAQMSQIENKASNEDNTSIALYFPTTKKLTSCEEKILRLIFIEGYSVSEVAQELGISRQAVNQSKLRGVAKIKAAIS